jgi:hypothetical protein
LSQNADLVTDLTVSGFRRRAHRHVKDKRKIIYVETVMDSIMTATAKPQQFKNPPELREYWRLHKRASREKQK